MVKFEEIDFRYINAEFIMTNGCNLRCDYCFERQHVSEGRKVEFLDFETMCGYMELILKNRQDRETPAEVPSWVNFFGGEPMLNWKDILKLMNKYKDYGFFRYSIITNGLLVNEAVLQEAKGLPILWQISLDSVNPAGNEYRFKNRSKEFTAHVVEVIEQIHAYRFETPIISSTITDKSVTSMIETYHYFAEKRIPIKWQCILERLGDQSAVIPEYDKQNREILDLLVKNPFNIPSLWENVIGYFQAIRRGDSVPMVKALSEAASPNNIYIVGPSGRLYLNTNNVNAFDSIPEFSDIGGLPNGIDVEKLRNHPYLKQLSLDIGEDCLNCPSFAVNPCCIEQKFFVYPRQFKGNCSSMLSATAYALEFLQRRGQLNELR